MSDPLCRDCLERGSEVKATRVIRTTPVCDVHMRERLGMPAAGPLDFTMAKKTLAEAKEPTPEQERPMAKRVDWKTRREILADHAAGMNVNAIAKKHEVGWITAKTIIAGAGKTKNAVAAAGRQSPKPSSAPAVTQGNGYIRGILESLRAQRAKLDGAIQALEELE